MRPIETNVALRLFIIFIISCPINHQILLPTTKAHKDTIFAGTKGLEKKETMLSSQPVIRSLDTAVKLGLVNDILLSNNSQNAMGAAERNPTHPLRDIFGAKSLMCSSAGFEKATSQSPTGRIKPIIPETGLAPYGLYPQASITNARHSIGSLEPLRTSLHTYQGANKLGTLLRQITCTRILIYHSRITRRYTSKT